MHNGLYLFQTKFPFNFVLIIFRLNESTKSLSKSSHLRSDQLARRSIDEGIEPSSDDLGKKNSLKIIIMNIV